MIGRFRYYLQKASARKKEIGFAGLVGEAFDFLKRRRFFLQFIMEWMEYRLIADFRNISKTLISTLKAENTGLPKALIYASFDRDSIIRTHVIEQLRLFKTAGYQVIWVSTSSAVSSAEFSKIEPWVDVAIHRKNEGYDFASWKVGYYFLESVGHTSVVIMNDSCTGPAFDFGPFLKKMESDTGSVYGITKCYEIAEYIQSYFIHFGKQSIEAGVLDRYFDRISILHSKWAIVRFFEIGGSVFLSKLGYPLRALIDPKDPEIGLKMEQFNLTDPVRDPAGTEWVRMGLNPFYKRSNQQKLS